VSLEQLWAGWRHDYIVRATARERADRSEGTGAADGAGTAAAEGKGTLHDADRCVFCRIAQSGPPSVDNLMVWKGQLSFVVLNAYPYASGHVLVLPLRHVGGLGELTEAESSDVWSVSRRAVAAIEAAYEPDGLNLGANLGRAGGAGIPGHLHLHVLPRWTGDTNFMTSIAGTRVMPETLQAVWQKLSEAWPG